MIAKPLAPLCFHGGAAYRFIGEGFEDLDRLEEIIDADVLDAWFDPSPKALQVLGERLAWSLRCSPPVVPHGVERAIAQTIDVPESNLVCGAGSSSLIFLALRDLLSAHSRVLILDPTYGEYAHVISKVIGCRFDSFELCAQDNYRVDLQRLSAVVCTQKYDLVIIVNPNNPSGQMIQRDLLEAAINCLPRQTMVWIDEAYIDYAGPGQSLSAFAATRENVVVCKSLSKVLALSGLRVAYLVSHRHLIKRLKLITPPWPLSLPAQLVLIEALKDQQYYQQCYARTHQLRNALAAELTENGFSVFESTANFLLVDYPSRLPVVEDFLEMCSEHHLLLRNVRSMGNMTSAHSFRVAVKDAERNRRIVSILKQVKDSCSGRQC